MSYVDPPRRLPREQKEKDTRRDPRHREHYNELHLTAEGVRVKTCTGCSQECSLDSLVIIQVNVESANFARDLSRERLEFRKFDGSGRTGTGFPT